MMLRIAIAVAAAFGATAASAQQTIKIGMPLTLSGQFADAAYVLTPNAMAAGDVSAEAKKLMVVMNAATSVVITKSPYMIRTSVTLPQVMETFATWAATKGGIKQVYTMVTDYG